VLTARGVTAWRRLVTHLAGSAPEPARPPRGTAAGATAPVPLPRPVTAELIHALAAVAIALAGT
jgi:hypothetical protein